MNYTLEVCAGSLASALNAQEGGAHRIELCANLSEGGTTPSPGTIRQVKKLLNIPVFVLIRPRPGDFLYSSDEFEAMKEDILYCKEHNAAGVVLGILKNDGNVDVDRSSELVRLARPMQVTFHRAFDMTKDPFAVMEDIIQLGCDTILTSGQAASAIEGSDLISSLIKKAGKRITIMPGGGITENNVAELLQKTGAREVHASLRSPVGSKMNYRNDAAKMGKSGSEEYSRLETDPDRVRNFLNNLRSSSYI
jgi:copper homeostasis protein